MRKILTSIFLLFACICRSQQSKIVSDCTITYAINSSNATQQSNLGTKTVYVKAKDIRTDLVSKTFSQTIFYNSNTGNATVLKTVGDSKYISSYTAEEWKKLNAINEGASIEFSQNTKTILNYQCKEAILTLSNGNMYTIYFIPDIKLSVSENPFQFKNVPGLVLQYEAAINNNEKVIYTAIKIDYNPVPALQFEIPKTGYRVLH
jgi:GLPGLI family protein